MGCHGIILGSENLNSVSNLRAHLSIQQHFQNTVNAIESAYNQLKNSTQERVYKKIIFNYLRTYSLKI